ncbi:MAG: 2-amino-4-hydroxy-6-hydroxymethyldihydropteridine diphosphokinase [Actinomycetes bacterium]
MTEPVKVVFSLGSNLGDRLAHLRGAASAAGEVDQLTDLICSPVYETEPVGGPRQDSFLNAVLIAKTTLTPHAVLALARGWEGLAGRVRTERWGPRTLDVDVIVVGDARGHDDELTLPHPRAHERAFVLAPWHDVDPEAVLPGRGLVIDLLADLHWAGVVRRDDLELCETAT